MRVKFEIDSYNNVTVLNPDQEDNTIVVTQDGDKKIVFVSAPETTTSIIQEDDN